jgi:hypothetical protein
MFDLRILMDQAAEPVRAQEPDICARSGWRRTPAGRVLLQCPVRPVRVVMTGVLAPGAGPARSRWNAQRHQPVRRDAPEMLLTMVTIEVNNTSEKHGAAK